MQVNLSAHTLFSETVLWDVTAGIPIVWVHQSWTYHNLESRPKIIFLKAVRCSFRA